MHRWQQLVATVKTEIHVYRRVLKHPRTPRLTRWLLGLALAYLLSPLDLIPDWIPLLGQLDDLVIVPLLIFLALRFVPEGLVTECRAAHRFQHESRPQAAASGHSTVSARDPDGKTAQAAGIHRENRAATPPAVRKSIH